MRRSPARTPQATTDAEDPFMVGRVVKLSVIVPFFNVQILRPGNPAKSTCECARRHRIHSCRRLFDGRHPRDSFGRRARTRRGRPHPARTQRRPRHRPQHRPRRGPRRVRDLPRRRRLAGTGLLHRAPGRHRALRAATSCAPITSSARRAPGPISRVPHGRRGVVLDPRRGDPARRAAPPPSTTPTPGPGSTTAGSSTTDCCTSGTACAPPRTGRGSGDCTARRSPSPSSA